MSQRNPLNERYTTEDARTGKTRKSAASAKPVTKAASSVRVPGRTEEPKGLFARATAQANKSQAVKNSKKNQASKSTVQRRREQAIRSQYYNPDTPEYRKWKKIWWGMLGGAIAFTALSFLLSGQGESYSSLSYVCIGLSYFLLIVAIIFDFSFLRRMRNEYQETMIALDKSKKNSARRKEFAAEERRKAKEVAAKTEAAEQEEDRKLFRGLFTKKRATEAVATAKDAQARAEAAAEANAESTSVEK